MQIVTEWERKKQPFEQNLASKMIARVQQSLSLNESNANSHFILARIFQQQALNQPIKPKSLQLAEKHYLLAVQYQPTWDLAWATLANFHSQQYSTLPNIQLENKLIQTMQQAMFLGPFENKTQQILIPLIFKHWPLIAANKPNKSQAIIIIKHALNYHSYALLTLNSAKQYQQLDMLAPLVKKQWHKNRLKKYQKEVAK